MSDQKPSTTTANCQWCGREMEVAFRGRRRKFCSQACRQRAYEKRTGVAKGASRPIAERINSDLTLKTATDATSRPAGDDVVKRIGDGLFEVRCLAEDLRTALDDGMETAVLQEITQELIMKTREVERFIP
ncbi:hypothetical protein [Corynebacterium amycolatum]|uniref:hypothetical protein n=1 Tax=Corynebacterium amycolatum TaxID=43765 RepID=UPI00223B399B|nr:hypothetical protein [Corynebacterium amycolatum]MCT1548332.1 hypothetical protein [Corynebacterium amycolatum]